MSSSGQDEIESKIAEKESLISSLQSQLQAITSSVQDEVEEKITLKDKEIESLRIQLEALQNKLKAKDVDLQLVSTKDRACEYLLKFHPLFFKLYVALTILCRSEFYPCMF